MTPRAFDRVMIHVGAGQHLKLRPLTDSEWRCFIGGVLPIAAMAPIRGCLLVGDRRAEAEDVSHQAGTRAGAGKSALHKLRDIGIVYHDDELECDRVRDFEQWNPPPRQDPTAAERARRYRERVKQRSHRDANGTVTRDVTHPITPRSALEVEVEEKTPPTPPGGNAQGNVEFEEWLLHHQQTTGHPPHRKGTKALAALAESFAARRGEGYTLDDLKAATVGAHADPYRREHGYDVAESVLRPTKVAALIAKGRLRVVPPRRSVAEGVAKAFGGRT